MFFSYAPGVGFETHDTEEKAKAAAEECLEYRRDNASQDGWPDDITEICYGVIKGVLKEVDGRKPEPGSDFDYICDYKLVPTATNTDCPECAKFKILIEKSGLEEVPATRVEAPRDGRGRPGSPKVVSAGTMLSPKGEVERFKKETETLHKLANAMRRAAFLEVALRRIESIAHENSTGPAIPDVLWEIRNIAQEII